MPQLVNPPYQGEHSDISRAFLEGIEEVYGIMFTTVYLELMDEESTITNVYDETPVKVYQEPIQVISKVETFTNQGEEPVQSLQVDATFTIPTKQLLDNAVPHVSQKDFEMLAKARIAHNGIYYLVDKVNPRVNLGDVWQFYVFSCTRDLKTSVPVESVESEDGDEP